MDIEFDEAKRLVTLRERGLDFTRARDVFSAEVFSQLDDRHPYGEPRYITAGYLDGDLIVMVWTPRGPARRIVSMRKCHAKERRRYQIYRVGRSR